MGVLDSLLPFQEPGQAISFATAGFWPLASFISSTVHSHFTMTYMKLREIAICIPACYCTATCISFSTAIKSCDA